MGDGDWEPGGGEPLEGGDGGVGDVAEGGGDGVYFEGVVVF